MAVASDVFEAVGGFDPRLDTCEDVDLSLRIRRRGDAVWSDPNLRAEHRGDAPTLAALFRAELWRGKDALAVTRRHWREGRELRSGVLPILHWLLFAAALLFVGVGKPGIALASLAPLVAIWCVHAARMLRRAEVPGIRSLAAALAVACTYHVARAAAPLRKSGYHRDPKEPGA